MTPTVQMGWSDALGVGSRWAPMEWLMSAAPFPASCALNAVIAQTTPKGVPMTNRFQVPAPVVLRGNNGQPFDAVLTVDLPAIVRAEVERALNDVCVAEYVAGYLATRFGEEGVSKDCAPGCPGCLNHIVWPSGESDGWVEVPCHLCGNPSGAKVKPDRLPPHDTLTARCRSCSGEPK